MSETQSVRAIVIGGGIVGASTLYWLTRLGWNDVVLLERRTLTSGSTWHAAGNVTHFGHYTAVTNLYVNSLKTYKAASSESGQEIDFHQTGSLRLANTAEELRAYENLRRVYEDIDAEYRIVGPSEMEDLHPLLNTKGVFGAAHTPDDGHLDPTSATHALAKAARLRGAEVKVNSPVTGIHPIGNKWTVTTDTVTYLADHVVLATSFWAREMVAELGLNLPIYPVQHHEVLTSPIPELEVLNFEVPAVRDPYAPSNTRQEGKGFLCGVYEADPQFWAADGIPPDFQEELLIPDPERLEAHLLRVIERIPSFGEVGIKAINNGPMAYTPDGLPMLGPVETHPGLWLATGFNIGIGTGGGSAQYLANWMNDGVPTYNLPIVYPSRYGNDISTEAALAQIHATYAQGYVMPNAAA